MVRGKIAVRVFPGGLSLVPKASDASGGDVGCFAFRTPAVDDVSAPGILRSLPFHLALNSATKSCVQGEIVNPQKAHENTRNSKRLPDVLLSSRTPVSGRREVDVSEDNHQPARRPRGKRFHRKEKHRGVVKNQLYRRYIACQLQKRWR